MGWSQLIANLTLSYSLLLPPQQDRGRRGKSRNEKHFRSIWSQKDHLISLSAKQTLFVKNKFIVNENKYGITYLGIGRKRTVNQMFTCLEKTALLPFFPYSTSSQIPLSSLLLPQVTLHPYSEPMHHMRLGNVCVCESYSQHIVVSSCHSLLFTFFLCSGVGSPYHCRREKYLSLN